MALQQTMLASMDHGRRTKKKKKQSVALSFVQCAHLLSMRDVCFDAVEEGFVDSFELNKHCGRLVYVPLSKTVIVYRRKIMSNGIDHSEINGNEGKKSNGL